MPEAEEVGAVGACNGVGLDAAALAGAAVADDNPEIDPKSWSQPLIDLPKACGPFLLAALVAEDFAAVTGVEAPVLGVLTPGRNEFA